MLASVGKMGNGEKGRNSGEDMGAGQAKGRWEGAGIRLVGTDSRLRKN